MTDSQVILALLISLIPGLYAFK
ncbi:MAG: photosystem I reaction center subunit XII, partial [Merismopedia sp. SIO2A8]|nr:photosystem I reaction center subunit XII [Merismopedia sp. SIO2A8]